MTIDTTKLRELAQKATPQNFETAAPSVTCTRRSR